MKHRPEIEVKLEVENLRVLKRRLRDAGFRCIEGRHFESNTLFDFPDVHLRTARCLLRLRHARNQWILTYKGAPSPSDSYKIRVELETAVEDGELLKKIFAALGLELPFRYEKFRTVYAQTGLLQGARHARAVLDETPVGNYLELEGPKRWIDEVARRLGYTRQEYITASYATLHRRICQQKGVVPRDMFFLRRKS